jgi:hypothetical protein
MSKMKTYVLMLAKTFPADHPRAGQETHFAEKYLEGEKIHTIRANAYLWLKREKEIDQGNAVLSIRQWEGKPYKSKQIEIAQLTKIILEIISEGEVDGLSIDELAKNDGLLRKDFEDWFKGKSLIGIRPILVGMVIIHFGQNVYWGKPRIIKDIIK